MRKFHVAPFSGQSGISKYARDFYDLVLSDRGYVALETADALDSITKEDIVHLELGLFCSDEIKLLYDLIQLGHPNIEITLHDPPFIRWPYFKFNNRLLNTISKIIHLYFRNLFIGDSIFSKLNKIYVLTHKGRELMCKRYSINNVFYLPHILQTENILDPSVDSQNMLYFGFIGKNKGLEYALKLHEGLLETFPDIKFYVIGDATSSESIKYLERLKKTYSSNVEYLGFVEESMLHECFRKASIAVLPYSEYKSVVPASGSILRAMSFGKVVCTTNVNAVSDFICDDKTGFFLKGGYNNDLMLLQSILNSRHKLQQIAEQSVSSLRQNHNAFVVGCLFDKINVVP